MAAAFHWEARRKQGQLEKRLRLAQAAATSEGMQQPDHQKEASSSKTPQNQPPQGTQQDACPCRTHHVLDHSGKLLKRYNNTEYSQQW